MTRLTNGISMSLIWRKSLMGCLCKCCVGKLLQKSCTTSSGADTRSCLLARAHTHARTQAHTHTHTYIHKHIHTPACLFVYLGFLTFLFVYVWGGWLSRACALFVLCLRVYFVCVCACIYIQRTYRHLFTKHNLIEEFQLDQVALKEQN